MMSDCRCQLVPCICACSVPATMCDRDRHDNVWVERGTEGAIGVCLLDTLTEEQVINVIEKDERARTDLLRVTSNERLLEIARETKRLTTAEEADLQQKWVNRNESPAAIPFYGLFRGQPPFAQ